MRIISSEELDLVAGGSVDEQKPTKKKDDGGGFFGALSSFLGGLFGSGGGNGCVPSSNTSNGITTTQTCGPNGVGTTTITGPGYAIVQTAVPSAGASGSVSVGNVRGSVNYSGGTNVTTTSVINGRVSHSR